MRAAHKICIAVAADLKLALVAFLGAERHGGGHRIAHFSYSHGVVIVTESRLPPPWVRRRIGRLHYRDRVPGKNWLTSIMRMIRGGERQLCCSWQPRDVDRDYLRLIFRG